MLYTELKSKLLRIIASLGVGGMLLAAVIPLAFATSPSQPANADEVTPPPVPNGLEVPAGNRLFLVGHAVGTQNYVCLPSGAGASFVLFTPEATLFDEEGEQIITHFFSPNPKELNTNPRVVSDNLIRAAWQDSRDTSSVWAKVEKPEHSSTDSDFVATNSIAWLKLTVAGVKDGPTGGDRLSNTTFVQRLNTRGGLAPSARCASLADVGTTAFVPYTADYFFYKETGNDN